MGVAPKMVIILLVILGVILALHYGFYPRFVINAGSNRIFLIIGIAVALCGVPFVALGARQILLNVPRNRLCTESVFKITKHPMYAAYLVFILPGIGLMFRSWLTLALPVIGFIIFKIFIKEEEKWCKENFGDEYDAYRKSVLIKFI